MQIQSLDNSRAQLATKTTLTHFRHWLPTPGNVIFTLIVVIGVLWAQNAGALALFVTPPPINIPYQGRLADRAGATLGGEFKMTFALYNVAAGSIPLWNETYQDANKVRVNNGLFNVLLGSLAPIDQSVITANPELYLGVTINDDTEMQPRVKLGSVPFATQAWTVPDGLITTAKLAGNAVTSDRIADNNVTTVDLAPNAVTSDRIVDGNVATADLADQAVTMAKLGPDVKLSLPAGSVILWSGAIAAIPGDWQLCDGTNGMPDLRNRFVVGAGAAYAPGVMGGVDQVTLSVAQMPSHNHSGTVSRHPGGEFSSSSDHQANNEGNMYYGMGTIVFRNNKNMLAHDHSVTINETGGNQPFDNRPPYYALAFICKK